MLLHSGLKLHLPLNDTICESAMTLLMICLTLYHHFLLLLAELSYYCCAHVCIALHPFCKFSFLLKMFSFPFKTFAKFVPSFLCVVFFKQMKHCCVVIYLWAQCPKTRQQTNLKCHIVTAYSTKHCI